PNQTASGEQEDTSLKEAPRPTLRRPGRDHGKTEQHRQNHRQALHRTRSMLRRVTRSSPARRADPSGRRYTSASLTTLFRAESNCTPSAASGPHPKSKSPSSTPDGADTLHASPSATAASIRRMPYFRR